MNPSLELHENPSLSRPLRRDEELAAMQPRVSSFQYSCCSSPYSSGHLRKWRIYPVYTQKQLDSLRKNDDEVDLLRKKNYSNGCFFFMLFQCNKFGNKWLASRFTGILFFKQTHIDELCHDMLYCLAVGNQDSQEMISKKGSGHVIFVGCRFPEKLVTSDHS